MLCHYAKCCKWHCLICRLIHAFKTVTVLYYKKNISLVNLTSFQCYCHIQISQKYQMHQNARRTPYHSRTFCLQNHYEDNILACKYERKRKLCFIIWTRWFTKNQHKHKRAQRTFFFFFFQFLEFTLTLKNHFSQISLINLTKIELELKKP